ncbi:MAG: hypothetical protein COA63_004955 [Methylophaga sp.]|nr:hypothetical protein [Methylophaga sp.]
MQLDNLILLAAPTARSQAYLQVLVASNLLPREVIFLGEEVLSETQEESKYDVWNEIFIPDLNESIPQTCERLNIPITFCNTNSVNSPEAINALKKASSKIIVYSGFGGQIVSEEVLSIGSDFLHMHSGWLPEYRGSTTLYYALLDGEPPAVTALILDKTIDTGPIVARKKYPIPSSNMDLDRVYDSAIRADLLVDVVKEFVKEGVLPYVTEQDSSVGSNYYVVHPVLKHLAILSLRDK